MATGNVSSFRRMATPAIKPLDLNGAQTPQGLDDQACHNSMHAAFTDTMMAVTSLTTEGLDDQACHDSMNAAFNRLGD